MLPKAKKISFPRNAKFCMGIRKLSFIVNHTSVSLVYLFYQMAITSLKEGHMSTEHWECLNQIDLNKIQFTNYI